MASAPSSLGTQSGEVLTFGGKGSGTGQFMGPLGVTVSDEGEIFVADYMLQRIQVFTLQGTFVRQFPTVVSGEEKISRLPQDVAMDGEGNLWVVGETGPESADFAVQYNKQGRVLRKFDLQKTGFSRGVAVDTRRNHILITQTMQDSSKTHGEVLVFRPDGTLVRTVGQQQGMKGPQYITVDGEGNILVSDNVNSCVFVYNEDGQFLLKFGGEGSDEGKLYKPRGICTDRAGNIIVADRGNNRVEMFDKTGKFLKHITTDMGEPQAVAMATQGQLIVTDYDNDTVSIFPTY
ncbi:protein meiotic P26-like [Branchiostoma floridae x Branchiostoma japonicum]